MGGSGAVQQRDETLAKIDRTPLVTTVMDRITAYIESEHLEDGARLPSERQLRDQLNVGRSTVREALKALEALGVVQIRQGAGVFVSTSHAPDAAEAPRAVLAQVAATDWSQLGLIVEARLAIEPYAAALAARRRTDEQLLGLEEELARFDAAADTNDKRGLVVADVNFHGAIAEIGSPVLAHTLRDLGVLLIKSRYISLQRVGRRSHVAARHRAIYDAIAERDDILAYEAMAAHLTDFVHELGYHTVSSGRGTHLLEIGIPTSLRRTLEDIDHDEVTAPEPESPTSAD
jgi:GntR family transcriptional regulator, transcriptional repressor for pyruvate dehydrogenase complex